MITDTRRLLNGFTFTLPDSCPCYVAGCYTQAVIGRLHRQFGPVDACADHDPERVAYATPFGARTTPIPPPIGPTEYVPIPNDDNGHAVRLRRPVPIIPPTGTAVRAM